MSGSEYQTLSEKAESQAAAPMPGPPPGAWGYAQQRLSDPRRKSPALACILSSMPGLGQVYVGYYKRGFIHAIIVASIIALLAAEVVVIGLEPLFGIFLAFFWLYNIIDAGRRAAFYNYALEGIGKVDLPEELDATDLHGSILGGALLIAFGAILLSHTLLGMSLEWVRSWWPLAPILFGLYLLARGIMDRDGSGAGKPPARTS